MTAVNYLSEVFPRKVDGAAMKELLSKHSATSERPIALYLSACTPGLPENTFRAIQKYTVGDGNRIITLSETYEDKDFDKGSDACTKDRPIEAVAGMPCSESIKAVLGSIRQHYPKLPQYGDVDQRAVKEVVGLTMLGLSGHDQGELGIFF